MINFVLGMLFGAVGWSMFLYWVGTHLKDKP